MSYSVERRQRAISLMATGMPAAEVGRRVGVADKTVTDWWHRHQDGVARLAVVRPEPRQPFPGHCWRVVASFETGPQRYSLIPRGHAAPFGTVIASEWVEKSGEKPINCYSDGSTTAKAGKALPIHHVVLGNLWKQIASDKATACRFITAAVALMNGADLCPADVTAANRATSALQDDGWFRYCRDRTERALVAGLVANNLAERKI